MTNAIIIATAVLLGGYLAFSRRLSKSASWQATVTPLASIMGSGFLVSAPLLAGIVGKLAVLCMAAAYFISVTYYLQLLAAFVLNAVGVQSQFTAHCITTGLLLAITAIGMWKGLTMLEGVERYAVALNLGMVGALLVGLGIYDANLVLGGTWALPDVSSTIDLKDARILLGLLIVVQGFETSRYMGDQHPAEQRIATMRAAQLISAAIYIVFIGLTTGLFHSGLGSDVTAIISITAPVAAVLPILLSVAAIGSQFSAAVVVWQDKGIPKRALRIGTLMFSAVTCFLVFALGLPSE